MRISTSLDQNINNRYKQQSENKAQDSKSFGPTFRPSFGKIMPEHMFIRACGYEKNTKWANHAIEIIEQAKEKAVASEPFEKVLQFLADGYGSYKNSKNTGFGIFRKEHSVYATKVESSGKYGQYYKQLVYNALSQGEVSIFQFNKERFPAKAYTSVYEIEPSKEIVPLNQILLAKLHPYAEPAIMLKAPSLTSAKKVLPEAEELFNKVISNKSPLTKENIEIITKDIAKIHWLLSHARLFQRGSAGIADSVVKTLFEAKGIQVSRYKDNIDPNIEAFIRPLDNYIESFSGFFHKPLKPFGEAKLQVEEKSFFNFFNMFKKGE